MALKDDFMDVFVPEMTDDDFCKGIADAIKSYVSTLSFSAQTVAGADTTPTGTFAGSASGMLAISGSTIESTLKAVCTPQMRDAQLASAFGNALMADAPTFTVTISGNTTTTTTPPVTSPSIDSGVVTAVFVSANLVTALTQLFNQQKTDYENASDDDFASTLAEEVSKFYTSAVCTVNGATHLSGAVGAGTISE